MPFLPLADGAQVELVHLLDGSICETTFTFTKRPTGGTPTLADLGVAVSAWWRTFVLPNLSVSLTYLRYVVTDISTAGGTSIVVNQAPGITGGAGGGSQAANVSARMNYIVALPPGGRKGCSFIPGIPISATVGNRMPSWWRVLMNDRYSNLIDIATLHNWLWVVESKFHNNALRPTGEPYRVDITEISSPVLSQRRSRLHNTPIP